MKRWENGKYIDLTVSEEVAETARRALIESEVLSEERAAAAREARIAAFRAKARTGQVSLADLVDVVSALVGD